MLFKEKISDEMKRISNLYIQDVSSIPLLDKKQQDVLIKAWKEHKNWDARNQLIRANTLLVINRALFYFKSTFPLSELIAVGNEGLIKATDTYDETKNTKFSSYAYSWINAKIMRYIKEYSEEIHMPHNLIDEKNKEKKILDDVLKYTGFDLNDYKSSSSSTYSSSCPAERIIDDIEDNEAFIEEKSAEETRKIELMQEVNKLSNADKSLVIDYFGLDITKPYVKPEDSISRKDRAARIKEVLSNLKIELEKY